MSDSNPYSAPTADVTLSTDPEKFELHPPRAVPVSRGWSWIAEGFELFKQDWLNWIGICVVGFIVLIALSVIPVINMVASLTTYIWIGGLLLGCKALYDGQPIKLDYLFAGFRNGHLLPLLGLSIFLTLLYAIVLGVVLGSGAAILASESANHAAAADPATILLPVLIVVTLTLPLAMAGWFAPALIVLNKVPVFSAMAMSFKACLVNVLPFTLYGLALAVLFILASIPLGLGLLVMIPVLYASLFVSYKDIFIDR